MCLFCDLGIWSYLWCSSIGTSILIIFWMDFWIFGCCYHELKCLRPAECCFVFSIVTTLGFRVQELIPSLNEVLFETLVSDSRQSHGAMGTLGKVIDSQADQGDWLWKSLKHDSGSTSMERDRGITRSTLGLDIDGRVTFLLLPFCGYRSNSCSQTFGTSTFACWDTLFELWKFLMCAVGSYKGKKKKHTVVMSSTY